MSKLYCVECPFPGGGNSSDNSPWIAVLLRAFHNISGYAVAFFFSQFLLRAPLSANATPKQRLKREIAQLCLFGRHFCKVQVCDRRHLRAVRALRHLDCGPEEPHPPNPHPTARIGSGQSPRSHLFSGSRWPGPL